MNPIQTPLVNQCVLPHSYYHRYNIHFSINTLRYMLFPPTRHLFMLHIPWPPTSSVHLTDRPAIAHRPAIPVCGRWLGLWNFQWHCPSHPQITSVYYQFTTRHIAALQIRWGGYTTPTQSLTITLKSGSNSNTNRRRILKPIRILHVTDWHHTASADPLYITLTLLFAC